MAETDFVFHWDGGGEEWNHLHVVRFGLDDRLSVPVSLRVLLHARSRDRDVDPYALVGRLCTLRLATLAEPTFRSVHGLVVSAEDRGQTRHGSLVELVIMPPVARAMHRVQSRIFLEKSLREILTAVLAGDPRMTLADPKDEPLDTLTDPFVVPKEHFAFRIHDPARIDDPSARPYVVQYEESDFDFVARLLEDEGIAYHFEHTHDAVVLVMSDFDDGRAHLEPFDPLGPEILGRQLGKLRAGGRLRPTKVTLLEYNWQKPQLDMAAEAKAEVDDLFVRRYPGGYVESKEQGAPLAKAWLDRLHTEARYATAEGSCRLLGAGSVFHLAHELHRFEGEYLVTAARSQGVAPGELTGDTGVEARLEGDVPFRVEVELARRGDAEKPEESRFRPARTTPRPRIHGTQTAIVTDEPGARGAEIHVGGPDGNENGCVRLRFFWDTEAERHDQEATSTWVRVSQVFAGAGGGAVFHPRVGTEVIVAYEEGDPDRPLVVGRVYNGIQPAAAKGKGAATVSTLKTLASPGGKVFNELQFDDTAGEEKVNLTAGKDWNSNVGNDRTETVKNDSSSTVDVNRTEHTGANRTTTVGGNNKETVTGNEVLSIGVNQDLSVGANQSTSVSAARTLTVGASQSVVVGASHSVTVGGPETYLVGATQSVTVGAAKTETIGASYSLTVAAVATNKAALHIIDAPSTIVKSTTDQLITSVATIDASASAKITTAEFAAIAGGSATLQGGSVDVTAEGDVTISGGTVKIKAGNIILEGGSIKISGGVTEITGGVVKVN